MLDRGASINQQQMAMCNVQTSQLLSTLCFVILSKESTILYFKNFKKKQREVPLVPIQKTQRK
jgi:hypothetical protein